jgi:hydrogenase maturation protease
MNRGVLIAGVGNIFLGDDGWGVEVVRQLHSQELPELVKVKDFGIRGVHLAYELLDGYDLLILVDAVQRGRVPGTVFVIEPDLTDVGADSLAEGAREGNNALIDAHGMEPTSVFALLKTLRAADSAGPQDSGRVRRAIVVGCEPQDVGERMGLSDAVTASVPEAVRLIRELVDAEVKRAGVRDSDEGKENDESQSIEGG